MALIEIYHVVADQLPVNQDFTTDIIEGMCVDLQADGTVGIVDVAGAWVYGIAGDTQSNTTAGTPYTASLIMGAGGTMARSTENRVSDFFNETGASALLTVYTSGGKFATDQYAAARVGWLNSATLAYSSANGLLTDVAGAGNVVGIIVSPVAAYPSGVPGADTADNNISLGDYVVFKLLV